MKKLATQSAVADFGSNVYALIDLVTVLDVILTGRQQRQKSQCLCGNSMVNNFFKNWILHDIKILSRRLYSPTLMVEAVLKKKSSYVFISQYIYNNFAGNKRKVDKLMEN